jgi:hypothetical protein
MVAANRSPVNDLGSPFARLVCAKLNFYRKVQDVLSDLQNHVHELSGDDPTDRDPAGFAVAAVPEVLAEVEMLLRHGHAEDASDRLRDLPACASDAFAELLDVGVQSVEGAVAG